MRPDYLKNIFILSLCAAPLLLLFNIQWPVSSLAEEAVVETNNEVVFQCIFISKIDAKTGDPISGAQARIDAASKALQEGRDFLEVAREFSDRPEDPEMRGLPGATKEKELPKDLRDMLFSMKPTEVSRIRENRFGYAIYKVNGFPIAADKLSGPPPTPTPKPTEYPAKMAAYPLSFASFRPASSTTSFHLEDGYVWSSDSPAVFYAPVNAWDETKIVGFCVWLIDKEGTRRPHAELLAYTHSGLEEPKLIAWPASNGPNVYTPWAHWPGIDYDFDADCWQLVVRVTLYSGDRNQGIRGGVVMYTHNSRPGLLVKEDTTMYLSESAKYPGLCPGIWGSAQMAGTRSGKPVDKDTFYKEYMTQIEQVRSGTQITLIEDNGIPSCCSISAKPVVTAPTAVKEKAEGTLYGVDISLEKSTPLDQIIDKPNDFSGKIVRIEGKLINVCPHSGCFFTLKDSNGKTFYVKLDDSKHLQVPTDSNGRDGIVQGKVINDANSGPYLLGEGALLKH